LSNTKYDVNDARALAVQGLSFVVICQRLGWNIKNATYAQRQLRAEGVLVGYHADEYATGNVRGAKKRFKPDIFPTGTIVPVVAPAGDGGGRSTPLPQTDTFDEVKGTRDGVRITDRAPKSLQELMELFSVDQSVWSVVTYTVKSWEMGYKDKDDVGTALPLYSISAKFQRSAAAVNAKSDIQAMLAEAKLEMPPYIPIWEALHTPRHKPVGRDLRCVILTPENHFGKHCWGMQTGEDYDLSIALSLYWEGLNRLLHKVSVYGIDRFTFVVGNDLQNADTIQGTTTAGTPQDNDGRFPKVFTATRKAMTGTIQTLLEVAPAKVILVSGNHDAAASYCLGDALDCRYETTPHVEIDNSPRIRKYDEFGQNLHGFTHGDKQKIADLPLQMTVDQREASGRTAFKEWFTGHTHTMKMQDIKGTLVRTISSLAPADRWHDEGGYQGNRRAWEAFLYDHDAGIVASVLDIVQPSA
jgi:predicted phosphodiesterase